MDLKDKVVLITGGARRIGRAISLALAERGARVVIHYSRSGEAAEETLKEIKEHGGEGILLQADLMDEGAVAGIIGKASEWCGQVDILINNAAIFEAGGFIDTTSENWDRHFAINLKAPFLLSQSFARQIPDDGQGKIIFLSDWRGIRPGVGHFAYTLTKSALITMTKSVAKVVTPRITVNSIALGAILPPEGADEDFLARKIETIPLRRSGSPADVVATVQFLLEGSDFITGETILVDGGEHL
ncbi:MAG: SDR family oxidoreductase [Deltaproteobacteria bacterium]|nr:SDR family oxidoreductase [Deltaproteobacteria bacterium]